MTPDLHSRTSLKGFYGAWLGGNKTRLRIREDTEPKNFPLFCPKCKQETLSNVKQLNLSIIREPDAEPITNKIIVVIGSFS